MKRSTGIALVSITTLAGFTVLCVAEKGTAAGMLALCGFLFAFLIGATTAP